jgi:hypothetical protein
VPTVWTDAVLGEIRILLDPCIVTLATADFVVSAFDIAVTLTESGVLPDDGAV